MCVCVCAQSCPTHCDSMNYSPPGFAVHGLLQARILKWIAISSSRGSSWPQDWALISCISCFAGGLFTTNATWEAPLLGGGVVNSVFTLDPSPILGPAICWIPLSFDLQLGSVRGKWVLGNHQQEWEISSRGMGNYQQRMGSWRRGRQKALPSLPALIWQHCFLSPRLQHL